MWIRTLWLVLVAGCIDIDTINNTGGVDSDDLTALAKPATGEPDPACSTCDAFSASGRAYGMAIAMRDVVIVPPTPDTSAPGAARLVQPPANLPLGVTSPNTNTAFFVSDVHTSDASSASDAAAAMTDQISVSAPNLLLYAAVLRAVATSSTSHAGASASATGSMIQYLNINGQVYQNLDTPRTIAIRNHGLSLGEVRVLETSYDTSTPDAASCQVNALHIILFGRDGNSDLVIAHAESGAITTDQLPP